MRNMLFAYAALGLIAVASSVNAQEPQGVLQDAAQAVAQGVQADAAVMDHKPMAQPMADQPIVGTPIVEQPMVGQPMMEHSVIGQPMAAQPMIEQPMTQHVATHGQMAGAAPCAVEQYQPTYAPQYQYRSASPQKQNVFQKLMEMERKKNAWLKKTFLNR